MPRILMFALILGVVAFSCKKKDANAEMAGVHIWSGILITHDSASNDTTIITPFQQSITVYSSTVVGLDGVMTVNAAYNNNATLNRVSTDQNHNTITFVGDRGYWGSSALGRTHTYYFDSIIYNSSNGSMMWYERASGGNWLPPSPSTTSIMYSR